MRYNIRGDKMVVTDSIKSYIETKINKLDKYFVDSESMIANVLVKVRGRDQIVEVTIPTSKFILRSEENKDDLYAAIDIVTDKLERQIRKNKTKLKRSIDNAKSVEFNFEYEIEKDEEEDNAIVKRKKLDMKPMDEEEAILEMNLLGHDFFVFKNSKTNSISVLYKRKDNNYGIIETN